MGPVPPSIEADPPDGNFVVKKGKQIEVACKASGNPQPEVHWTKEVRGSECRHQSLKLTLQGGGQVGRGKTVMAGSGLLLSSVTRQDEGLYICTASNGVGAPASASVRLTVLCKFRWIPLELPNTAVGITVTFYSPRSVYI